MMKETREEVRSQRAKGKKYITLRSPLNHKGFTLIELVVVIILLGILAAVVVSKFGSIIQETDLVSETATLKAHLRYAQYLAMNDTSSDSTSPSKWGIAVNGSSYSLIKDVSGTQSNPFSLPGESSATHSFAPITAIAFTVLFDEWGSPTITGSSPNIGGKAITITANTGFIP